MGIEIGVAKNKISKNLTGGGSREILSLFFDSTRASSQVIFVGETTQVILEREIAQVIPLTKITQKRAPR